MKVLITGGCGFIGSHIADYMLGLGHEVLVADNFFSGKDQWAGTPSQSPSIVRADITDATAVDRIFSEFSASVVLHMAAHHYIPYCERNPYEAYKLNLLGTFNVLRASIKAHAGRFFFASTGDVYVPSDSPHAEGDRTDPFTVYGRTKLAGEDMCRDMLGGVNGINVVIGRLFNAVGTRETNPHLVPEVIAQVAAGAEELKLGNLFPTRDFVDVRSQARAIADATLAVSGIETVNIGSGRAISVQRMVELIAEASGRELRIIVDPAKQRPVERNNLCADTARLVKFIGYAPDPASVDTVRAILAERGNVSR